MTLQQLEAMFPQGYWGGVQSLIGHNFWSQHAERTLMYDREFLHQLAGKKVLEVGAWPGLIAAALNLHGAEVTVMDSPSFHPEDYERWCDEHSIKRVVFDIVSGEPPITDHFDAATMSDVMLHIEGFPEDFFVWLLHHADLIYVVNYRNGDAPIVKATGSNLHCGFAIEGSKQIIEFAEKHGAKLVELRDTDYERSILILQGVK